MSEVELTEGEAEEALGRLLAWPEIARSPQLARFLAYIVERRLRGDVQAIKAYSIAVDVFGRPENFDPQTDPIVRVQARRLRALIDLYYQGPGAGDAIRIELPTGRYVPEFVRREPVGPVASAPVPIESPKARWDFRSSWLTLAAIALILSGAALATSFLLQQQAQLMQAMPAPMPTVLVMELQSLTGTSADVGMVAGLAVELVTDLEQFETLRVLYGGSGANADISADYVLSGIVRREDGGMQYSAILTEVATNAVIWNKAIAVASERLADPELLNMVSGELSRILGSPRGPLHRKTRGFLAETVSFDGRESLYVCRVLFDLYRERASIGAGERAQSCYAALTPQDQGTGQALAASASLLAEGIAGSRAVMDGDQRLELAGTILEQAVIVAPVSGFVWEQRARYLERIGDDGGAEAAYSSALQLNPANTDTLAARARHLALIGQLTAAEPLATLAISSAPNPPSWYLLVPALVALDAGDFRLAALYAQSYAEADRELGPILAVMAAANSGNQAIIASYLPRVLEVASFRANGVLTQLRKRILDEALIRDIRTALLSAGMPSTVLNSAF